MLVFLISSDDEVKLNGEGIVPAVYSACSRSFEQNSGLS